MKTTSNETHASCAAVLDQQEQTDTHVTLMRRMGLVLLALVLCVGLMPTFAWADDGDEFSVGLTIVNTVVDDGEDADVVYNSAVSGMTSDMTVADMLAAAGFTEADSLEATAGNRMSYYYDGQLLEFLGIGDEGENYWTPMFNNEKDAWGNASLNAKLVEDGHYQYIYGSSDTFEYTDAIPDPLNDAGDNTMSGNPYDATSTSSLFENLKARFSTGGSDDNITNDTVCAAIALDELGLGSDINVDKLLENAVTPNNESIYTSGVYAKYIIALTAAGVNCTQATSGDITVNLLSIMEGFENSNSMDVYSAVWILRVYKYGDYTPGDGAMTEEDLINVIMENRDDQGLFGDLDSGCDTETTAQAILALNPYVSDDGEVQEAVNTAKNALISDFQNQDDGGFGYSNAYPESNIDSTAMVITALTTLGTDCVQGSETTTANGSTPIGYLVAEADDDLNGYTDNESVSDEPMTASKALLALAATQEDQAAAAGGTTTEGTESGASSSSSPTTTASYPASNGSSSSPSTTGSRGSTTPSTTTSSTPAGSSLAKTGDTDTTATTVVVGAIALGALACAVVAARRMRTTQDATRH